VSRAGFNNVSYLEPKVPSLFTALTTGEEANNPTVYGLNSNPIIAKKNQVIEIVINNFDGGSHPMHLHGHAPQLVERAGGVFTPGAKHPNQQNKTGTNTTVSALGYTQDTSKMRNVPMRRDTWMIAPSGYTVIRFRANNPGVWLLHCHMEWHVVAGLTATIIEAPLELQKQQQINPAMEAICKRHGTPTAGNAAGNTKDFTDLTGANTVAPQKPRG
jgi:iron transport multicopper oxidase